MMLISALRLCSGGVCKIYFTNKGVSELFQMFQKPWFIIAKNSSENEFSIKSQFCFTTAVFSELGTS